MPDIERSDSERIDAQERIKFEVIYKSVLDKEDDYEGENKGKSAEKDAEKSAAESVTPPGNEETKQDISAPGIATPPTQTQDTDNHDEESEDKVSTTTEESTKKKKKIFRSDDPISWYGILVPSSLKSAQRSFIEAVDGSVPQIVSVMKEMRCVEEMVYELRKDIDGSVDSN